MNRHIPKQAKHTETKQTKFESTQPTHMENIALLVLKASWSHMAVLHGATVSSGKSSAKGTMRNAQTQLQVALSATSSMCLILWMESGAKSS